MEQASQLALGRNPFSPTRNPADRIPNPSFERALADVLSNVRRGEHLIPLLGAPGTGKTLLLEAARRALDAEMPVRSIPRGDLLAAALTQAPGALLVDEGERADASILARLTEGGWPAPVVIAFARLPEAMMSVAHAVRLRPLSRREARAHVVGRLARTGRQSLFSRAALDAVVGAADGNPRTLSLIAGSALFAAQTADAPEVDADHVRSAVAMRGRLHSAPTTTEARTWGWPVGQLARLTLNTHTAIAAAVGLVAIMVASITLVAPPPPRHGSMPRGMIPVMTYGRPVPVFRLSPAAVHPLTAPVPEPEPEPIEIARARTPRSLPSGDREIVEAAPAVSIARIATATDRPHAPAPASAQPTSPVQRRPAIAPAPPSLPPSAFETRSTSRLEALAVDAGSPTSASSNPVPPSSVALVESATARDDARAAREAAMEARDAMQIMRTARER